MFAEVLSIYINLIARILRRFEIRWGWSGITIKLVSEARRGVDERIAMIDAAKANLLEGVRVIEELRAEAERNKREAQEAILQAAEIKQNKTELEQQHESIKKIIQSDVTAFRTVAGVPSPAAVRRERIIGFISGVIASVVASGVVWGIAKILDALN